MKVEPSRMVFALFLTHLLIYVTCLSHWHLTWQLVAQMVKNLPEMQETWVQSLGQKDPLEKRMATHSSILAWRTPWTEEPGGLQPVGLQRAGHNRETNATAAATLGLEQSLQ